MVGRIRRAPPGGPRVVVAGPHGPTRAGIRDALVNGGFEAPQWSMRVSLANLPDEAYENIGRGVRTIARGYRDAYEASKTAPRT